MRSHRGSQQAGVNNLDEGIPLDVRTSPATHQVLATMQTTKALTRHNLQRLDRMVSREGKPEATLTPTQTCQCSDLCSERPREQRIRTLQSRVLSYMKELHNVLGTEGRKTVQSNVRIVGGRIDLYDGCQPVEDELEFWRWEERTWQQRAYHLRMKRLGLFNDAPSTYISFLRHGAIEQEHKQQWSMAQEDIEEWIHSSGVSSLRRGLSPSPVSPPMPSLNVFTQYTPVSQLSLGYRCEEVNVSLGYIPSIESCRLPQGHNEHVQDHRGGDAVERCRGLRVRLQTCATGRAVLVHTTLLDCAASMRDPWFMIAPTMNSRSLPCLCIRAAYPRWLSALYTYVGSHPVYCRWNQRIAAGVGSAGGCDCWSALSSRPASTILRGGGWGLFNSFTCAELQVVRRFQGCYPLGNTTSRLCHGIIWTSRRNDRIRWVILG